ncbi:hypothetical protein HY994_03180 [Candidatus Micrarchaeota archaeon]|nr:hypothetical protein [Candidatus Micrarchaeota archaeon]
MATAKKKDEKTEETNPKSAETKTDKPADKKTETKPGLTISIPTIAFDQQFKLKAPLLVLILLLFVFAAYLFQTASIHTTDLVDISRMQYSAAKAYSLAFILFVVLFSLVLALAMHFGHGQNWLISLLAFIPALLGAIVLGLMFSNYMGAFLAFAVTVGAASFFASRAEKLNWSGASQTAGRALLILAILAFAVTFMKVNANPNYYSDRFFNSAVALVPDVGAQVADAVSNTTLDESFLRGAISKETFASSISTDSVRQSIETIPGLSSFNQSVRQKWAETVKASLTSDAAYNQFITLGTASLQKAQGQIAESFKASAGTQAAAALQSVKKLPAMKQMTDNFALIMAFLVLSILSVVNFVIKLLATILTWSLGKLAFS